MYGYPASPVESETVRVLKFILQVARGEVEGGWEAVATRAEEALKAESEREKQK